MRMKWCLTLCFAMAVALVARAQPTPPAPADFKLSVVHYEVRKEPINRTEILFWKGRAFHVASDSAEVIVFNPNTDHIELLDLERMIHTDVTLEKLDNGQAKLRKAINAAIEKKEKAGGKGNQIAATMSRNLIDPKFEESFDAAKGRLRLKNPSVQIELDGEEDADRPRLERISVSLAILAKLGALRDPQAIPCFTRLDALKAMISGRHLRPTEMTVIYRLAGPPKKYRWTYAIVPHLTAEEIGGLSKISAVLERSKVLRFDHYETAPK